MIKNRENTTKSEDDLYIGQLEVYAHRCLGLLRSNRTRFVAGSTEAASLDTEIAALENILGLC